METLVRASRSPRRSELLKAAGIPFETADPDVDESFDCPAEEAVSMLSARKAGAVGNLYPGRWILAAVTLVVLGGIPLGKPSGPDDAARMLRSLSGRTHQVFTGVSVLSPDRRLLTSSDRSDVSFCRIPEEEILDYVRSGEPLDKAGAYALQGRASLWISRLEGSYSSVIGLPLYLVRNLLLSAGYRFQ